MGPVPLTPEFNDRRRRILVRGTGVIRVDDIVTLITSARADVEHRMWPMLVDAVGATTDITESDVDRLATLVQTAVQTQGMRGLVAIAASDDTLYARMLSYETKCAAHGINVIRIFRHAADADRWLDIVGAAHHYR
jgi:hypothetical protein